MNLLMYGSWLAGPLLQITLVIFMFRCQYHKAFPRFFSYVLFQTLKSACLFIAFRYFSDRNVLRRVLDGKRTQCDLCRCGDG
jgi:O-antigen ligase